MSKLSIYPPRLDGNDVEQKRQEIKDYFLNTYELFEKIFEVLKDDSVFYKKSEATRHPMIFYFGHTATFFINKLINMKIIENRINPEFESIFAVGVDEMSWDDLDSRNYKWPSVRDTRVYRQKVKELILKFIDELPLVLPITWDSEMWIILMGIEHERIHIETSSVLHRQMPLEFIKKVKEFKVCEEFSEAPQNKFVTIPTCQVSLGKKHDDKYYGWDNEYGSFSQNVEEFKTSKYLVSNAEYMEFVKDGGYEKKEFWSEEGLKFLKISKVKHPTFWILEDGKYFYRNISAKTHMPRSFPVDVNALEAEAFCRYKSKKDKLEYKLLSEAEYEAICRHVGIDDLVDDEKANLNLKYMSSAPVDKCNFNGIYDVVGNVWQWSRTPIRPFDGFRVHEAYDDFTVPTYDEKHALILGSSWASSGNLIMKKSRYAFRRHFYQHAGFRYVISNQENREQNSFKNSTDVLQNYELQYNSAFSKKCAGIALKYANKKTKALDLACGTGRISFELACEFDRVDGVDVSARFISVGVELQEKEYSKFKDKILFSQGDARNLKPIFNSYDLVVFTNLKERYIELSQFLVDVKNRLNKGGIFIMINENKITMDDDFEFLHCENIEDYEVSVWRKK